METPKMTAPPAMPRHTEIDRRILAFWKERRCFERLRELRRDRPPFRFIDGPITANNPMGVHHAWGRTLKDAFIRYKAMRGFSCRYQNGFDCQGLWLEVEVEKELGFKGKPDIERFGIDGFSRKCRERVEKFSRIQTEQSVRLGQWMDWDDSYYTHSDGNIVGIWHFLKLCKQNGWLTRKALPMPWCPRCGTSLSEHEMAGSHQDLQHLSVFVHLPLKEDPRRRLLLWTTTPWTLSSNTAAAVNPELTYCEVSSPKWPHRLILCKDALGKLKSIAPKVERMFPGRELLGLRYETFFPDLAAQKGVDHKVVPWSAVDATEGSGIVHIAPGCGREDHELGVEQGLAAISPVDDNGVFLPGFGWLTGRSAGEVADDVAKALEHSGKLLWGELYTHPYPVCWRCKNEVIFRLVDEWFIKTAEIKPRLKKAASAVQWMPEHMGKRMDDWLENMGDWCISRKRFWGMPLPFFSCSCGELTVVGSREELRALAVDPAAVDALPELHKPWIDSIAIRCPKCGGSAPRVAEVGDCWLDAGIVPYSTLGYFTDRANWERNFPAEWVCEMREQVRLWFYSMLFMGVTISDRAPYEKVLAYERMISEEGTKFSKTGYMIRFDEAVDKLGADSMRYLYCGHPVGLDLRFGFTLGELAGRKLCSLWNIYVFFATYALVDKPDLSAEVPASARPIPDRWLLARTHALLEAATKAYEGYALNAVVREADEFLEDVSNWYVRANRRRFWKNGAAADKASAYQALHAAIRTVTGVLAPIVPFITEEIWQNAVRPLLPGAPESVHHSDWPMAGPDWADPGLLGRTALVRKVISLALHLREKADVRVRQPLRELLVKCPDEAATALREQLPVLLAELNIKVVGFITDADALYVPRLALNIRAAGPVLRGDLGQVRALVENASVADMAAMVARFDAGQPCRVSGHDGDLPPGIFTREKGMAPGFQVVTEGDITLALDTRLDEGLELEGLARDLVRHLQVLRKEAGLEVTQRVELGLATASAKLQAAVAAHRDHVAEELLAVRIQDGDLAGEAVRKDFQISGHPLRAALKPAAPAKSLSSLPAPST
ncbi:MAG: isoleucine--tRNA ligase [Elusimicrobia bacterium]|nr:isoleucine--tRNA ligase [Elusimicrobiota bacterium]